MGFNSVLINVGLGCPGGSVNIKKARSREKGKGKCTGVYICRTVFEESRHAKKVLKKSWDYLSWFKIKQILLEANNILRPKNKIRGKWSLFNFYCDHFNLGSLPKGSHNWVVFIVYGLEQILVCKHSDAYNSNSLLRNVYPYLRCVSLETLECCTKAVGPLIRTFSARGALVRGTWNKPVFVFG